MEMTPLVDIVFLLLIFFLLTASYARPGMDLVLPEASTSEIQDHQYPCRIAIDAHGGIQIDGRGATLDDISKIPEGSEVLILEDKHGPYGVFVTILDLLRVSGIESISIITDEESI